MTNIGQVIQIRNRQYQVGRLGDLRVGSRIIVGYIYPQVGEPIHRIFCPSQMKNGVLRQAWQPAFGTIVSMRRHPRWRGWRIAEITGIPGEVLIGSQGRCLHEVEQ
jgi:hypothetical protein